MKPNSCLPAAAVFDMDGVLVNSNPFHVRKWEEFLRERGIAYDAAGLREQILGFRNDTVLRLFFGTQVSETDIRQMSYQLEERFRTAFRSHAQPLPGLRKLMEEFRQAAIPMAVASSAMSENVDFVVDVLKLRPYFRSIVSGDEVSHPKPDPEIYLKTAVRLNVPPAQCVAFEDSFVGIESAKRAGLKCVGIASTFPAGELSRQTQADVVVSGFEVLSLAQLRTLFNK